jgi:hypothetical protein
VNRKRDALRAGGMAALPIIGAAARVLDEIALDDEMSGILAGVDGAVHAGSDAPHARAAYAAPAGNVAVLDDNVLHSLMDEHTVNARVSKLEAADDDVVGFYFDVVVGEVEDIAHKLPTRGRRDQMPPGGRAGFADMEGLIAATGR